jgi:hypothetical protein
VMDGWISLFLISIQIIKRLQGNFVTTSTITFALSVTITTMAKATQKSHTNSSKSNSLMCFLFCDHFVVQFIEPNLDWHCQFSFHNLLNSFKIFLTLKVIMMNFIHIYIFIINISI